MKIDSSIVLKKAKKIPVNNLKAITKNNKKIFVGTYHKPVLKII
ncbi:hypothetical protein SAMN05880574_10933 [Chryseobacterium sp. RU37D]|nr:hypothetical protein SAMN05880574_10933 [Chryseobacterium sp. RU37D]